MHRPEELQCWRCGESLAALSLPLRRLEACLSCGAELHVCRMCEFFDTAVAKSCREPVAEEVKDKEKANFCDYFRPVPGTWQPADEGASAAVAQLQDLFGETDTDKEPSDPASQLDALFGKKKDNEQD